jgi:hypothetical protein
MFCQVSKIHHAKWGISWGLVGIQWDSMGFKGISSRISQDLESITINMGDKCWVSVRNNHNISSISHNHLYGMYVCMYACMHIYICICIYVDNWAFKRETMKHGKIKSQILAGPTWYYCIWGTFQCSFGCVWKWGMYPAVNLCQF